ncbi:MAG TPA: hypothetical protein VMW82_01925 [Candidatus Paceibacterota bacterium]|nr:hypothetical protein [Candidatus Paceibacterota bacterium]
MESKKKTLDTDKKDCRERARVFAQTAEKAIEKGNLEAAAVYIYAVSILLEEIRELP